MDKVVEHGVLVGLDEWFDTRLATLVLMERDGLLAKGYTQNLLVSGWWCQRTSDHFPGVSDALWRERYGQRSKLTLQHAVPTLAREAVMEIVKIAYSRLSTSPFAGRPVLHFNTWPYHDLNELEIKEICKSLIGVTNSMLEVRMMHLPPEKVTAEWLKEHISVFVCYHYTEWLSANVERVVGNMKTSAAKVGMIAPGMSQGEAIADRMELGRDLVSTAEMVRPVIGLDFAPVHNFSIPLLPKHMT